MAGSELRSDGLLVLAGWGRMLNSAGGERSAVRVLEGPRSGMLECGERRGEKGEGRREMREGEEEMREGEEEMGRGKEE